MEIDRGSLLVNELQLGSELNLAVYQSRPVDFAWLLCLLSDDPLEQREFTLAPASEAALIDLREQFALPEPAPIVCEAVDVLRAIELRRQLQEGGMSAIRLQQALRIEPLGVASASNVDETLLDNVSLRCRYRYQQQLGALDDELKCTPEAMLDVLDQLNAEQLVKGLHHAA